MVNITSLVTGVEIRIIDFFLNNINEQFAVREIARKSGVDYKLTHAAVQKLVEKGLLLKKRQANADICSLNFEGNLFPVHYVEMLKTREFLQKHRDLQAFFTRIKDKTKELFYTLLIFGSYAKGTARSSSDVDVLIITPTRAIGEEIERIIDAEAAFLKQKVQIIILDEREFVISLSEKKINVAKEVFKNHIIIIGAEAFYKGVTRK